MSNGIKICHLSGAAASEDTGKQAAVVEALEHYNNVVQEEWRQAKNRSIHQVAELIEQPSVLAGTRMC